MSRVPRFFRLGFWLVALLLGAARVLPVRALQIAPTFDTTITGDANAAAMESEINTSIGLYQSLYSDPIRVTIDFRYANTDPISGNPLPANRLSQSNWNYYGVPYANFLNALKADAKTANDAVAIANLPARPLATDAGPTSANGRAVNLNTPAGTVFKNATFDGVVTLNSNEPLDFNRGNGIAAGQYDAQRLIEHEIDEVLGLGSALNLATYPNDYRGNSVVRPQDLFRYSAAGVTSLTKNASAMSYLSIDGGKTSIVQLNQSPNGDYGDWLSPACNPPQLPALVQYAFTCPGLAGDIGRTSPEGIALDVIGYDLIPEPASMALLGPALFGLSILRRRAARS
jgi:hypothetical protein